ncbi:hypothetical protein VP01_1485g3 [Puccinia sorghi]|uniref:Uncharacterized protein n=1 Tax=Puccinia sorghi TaxID=27349 RepID=A0A0L6VJF7_9BASI|nr:hypothetical protein VP01_1485g3 [Puccinia sorghi]
MVKASSLIHPSINGAALGIDLFRHHITTLASFTHWITTVADLGKDQVNTGLQLKMMESPSVVENQATAAFEAQNHLKKSGIQSDSHTIGEYLAFIKLRPSKKQIVIKILEANNIFNFKASPMIT